METLQTWFSQQFMDNSLGSLFLAGSIVVAVLLLKKGLSVVLSRLLYKLVRNEPETVTVVDFIRLMRSPIELLILLVTLYLAAAQLSIPASWNWAPVGQFGFRLIALRLYQTTVMVALTWLLVRLIKFIALIFRRRAELTASKLDDQLVPFLRDLTILFVCVAGIFGTLDLVYDVNVVGLVAGLGIGGLAIALAARETLENLFASFAILIDRPFVTGDTVTAGTGPTQVTGTVEKIGFRSTRLRTDDGSLIAVPNRLMVSQSLDNLTERQQRRVKFFLKLALNTPPDTLKAIVEQIRQSLDERDLTRQNPALIQFDTFGESSLDILIQYYVATADWREFNRIKEEVNYLLVSIVHQNNGQFAFPARMVYLPDRSEHSLEQN